MSYASVAAKNSSQSPEEARAPPVDEVVHTEPVHNLVDVNHSINVVPNDFRDQPVKTETQAERIEIEHEQKEAAAQRAQERADQKKHELKKEKDKLKREAEDKKNKAKAKVKEEKDRAKQFAQENPGIAINIVALAFGTAALGFFGVRKYHAGELTWKLAGTWALGAVGLVGLDFVATKFLQARGWGNSKKE